MLSATQLVRFVQVAMAASIPLYAAVGELAARHHAVDSTPFHVLSFVAFSLVGATIVVRRSLVLPSEAMLHFKANDTLVIDRWKTGYILMYAMCEALALLGLVLRLIGFSLGHVWGFYLGGFVLLLLFTPRAPQPR